MRALPKSPKTPLSEFDVLRKYRLPNWGRWGRHDPDKPDPNRCGHSICVVYIPDGDEKGWVDGVVDVYETPIDFRDAEELDLFIKQMHQTRRQYIRRFFYLQKDDVRWQDLNEAIRALLDLIEANRRTNEEMKRRMRGERRQAV